MDRKDFLKKGLIGTGIFIAGAEAVSAINNNIDELAQLNPFSVNDIVGFNHLPNNNKQIDMAKTVLHKVNSRGHSNHGWLNSYHSFSFASYYNPERMHFGALRVLNDDTVNPGMGFGTHPHDNMEIISIPLEGDLEHRDSMGNVAVIKQGDIQVMSAGTGIQHSEFNKNSDKVVKFLQIWMFPRTKNVTPRYDQITLPSTAGDNTLQQILSPNADDDGVWVHQDAWFHIGKFTKDTSIDYNVKRKGNGVYFFVLDGTVKVNDVALDTRDGFGIWDTDTVKLSLSAGGRVLLMDVPMVIG